MVIDHICTFSADNQHMVAPQRQYASSCINAICLGHICDDPFWHAYYNTITGVAADAWAAVK